MLRGLNHALGMALAQAACVATSPPGGDPGVDSGGAPEGGGDVPVDDEDDEDEDDAVPDDETRAGDGRFGIVIVDVQETFVDAAANADIDGVIDRTGQLFHLGARSGLPFFITFEAATTGDHRLEPDLQPLVPAQAALFVKTTFDATGLAAFAEAIDESGMEHFVLVGAETDVCLMQTALGLRRRGYTIIVEQDAVFSSEPNVGPALRRMTQAGIVLADQAEVAAWADRTAALPDIAAREVPRATPGQIAIVLNHLDGAAVGGSSDPWRDEKLARLRELLLISEWFDVPLYGVGTDGSSLPSALEDLITKPIVPATEIDGDGVSQLVVAGSGVGLDDLVREHHGARTLFLMEDALVAGADLEELRALLDARYDEGDVPITYKSFYYEMTATVAFEDWPADWIERDAEYYERTQAPEDLPPISP